MFKITILGYHPELDNETYTQVLEANTYDEVIEQLNGYVYVFGSFIKVTIEN